MPFSLDVTRRHSRGPGGEDPFALVRTRLRDSRPARLALAAVLVAVCLVPGAQTAIAPATDTAAADNDLDKLKEKADEAKEELEKATEDYTEREKALEDAQDELVSTLDDLQETEQELAEMREPLSQLASTLYQQPDGGTLGMMTSGTIEQDLQVESYVGKLSDDQQELLEEANDLREEKSGLASDAQTLQAETQLERVELKDDLADLRDKSEESTEKLTTELEDRGLDVDTYMAGAECDPSKGENASDSANGLLPDSALCELPQGGEFLRADAAVDFIEMNQAYAEKFGEEMCVTSSYRDLPNQQRVFAEQPPGNAAVPGTSNHGWGLAIDLCGGVQNEGTPQFNWLEANSEQWGWFHPQWAYSSPYEPWHWEYEAVSGAD